MVWINSHIGTTTQNFTRQGINYIAVLKDYENPRWVRIYDVSKSLKDQYELISTELGAAQIEAQKVLQFNGYKAV